MKLLFRVKLKYFLTGTFLSLLLFLIFGFGGVNQAKAEISVDNSLFMNFPTTQNFTVGTCDNRVLVAIYSVYDYTPVNSLTYNGVAMTQIHDGGYSYHHGHYRVFILTNPASGTHNFVVNSNGGGSLGVVSLCGVDQTTPIADAQYFDNTYEVDFITTLAEGKSVFGISYSNFSNGEIGTYSYAQGTRLGYTGQDTTGVALYTATSSNNYLAHSFSGRNGGYKDYGFIAFNQNIPPPFATTYWAGVGSQYLKKNKENSVPIYYNFCNKYDDIKKLTFSFQPIRFGINKYTDIVIKDKSDFIGPQKCSGIYYAKITPTNQFSPSTGTLDAGISFVAELYDGTFKSMNVSIPYTTEGSTENYLENAIVEPLIVDMDTSTQTDLYFNYNFTGLTTSTTTVCAFYTNAGDSTDCTEIPADQPQGYGVIRINNPQVIDTVHVGFHAVELDMFSEVKSIIFFSKTSTIIGQYRASSSLGMIFGNKTAHDLACSPADWSEADSANWFNMIRLKCVTFESTIDLFMTTTQGLSNLVENSVNGFGAVLGNLFPFNIPYNIVKSFQDSKAELPLPLIYFDQFDSNNAISIKIPKEWAGGETDLIVPVFGKTVIAPENTPAGNFFDGIRAFSVYSIWFLYIRYMWEFAKKVKDEVYPEGSTDHFYFKKEVND